VKFDVHIDVSLLILGAMLSQNMVGKSDQPIVHASRLLNKGEQNYNTIEKKA